MAAACVASLALVSACGSSGAGGASSPAPRASSTEAALSGDARSICRYLSDNRTLQTAVRLASGATISSGSPDLGAVKAQLGAVAHVAPTYMQFAVTKILSQLGTSDTAQVAPDARLLAGECRSRGLIVPAVN